MATTALVESSGDGDAYVDPGESWIVDVEVVNHGTADAASTIGVLSSSSADIIVITGTMSYGLIAQGATVAPAAPAEIGISPTAPTSGTVALDLDLLTGPYVFPYQVDIPLGE